MMARTDEEALRDRENADAAKQIAADYCGIPTATPAQLAGIVAHMVSLGANPEVKDAQGDNLLDRANYACPPEVMKALGG